MEHQLEWHEWLLVPQSRNQFHHLCGFCCYQAYKSVDDGVTFTLQGTLPSGANRIVADPSFVNTAYAYTSQTSAALLKTTDGE